MMFIIELTYKVPLSQIDKYLPEHRIFLDKYFSQSLFVSSGPKVPRSGGIILARCENKTELMKVLKKDPFYKNNLADYAIIEYQATKGIL